jgi:hypothetical protein
MKKTVGFAVSIGVIVAVLAVFLVGPALAQEPTATPAPSTPAPSAPAGPMGRNGPGGGAYAALSTLLGMSAQDIMTARQSGKTLADIGKDKGVTDQQMTDALTSTHNTLVDQAVKAGKLTQPQADWLKQMTTTMAQLQLTNPFVPGKGIGAMGMFGGWGPMMGSGHQGQMGRGRTGGWGQGGNKNAPNQTPAPSTTPSASSGAGAGA